jgi:transcriptional regulator with XRE-family HTH domain
VKRNKNANSAKRIYKGKSIATDSLGAVARDYYLYGPQAAANLLAQVPQDTISEVPFTHLRPKHGQEVMRTESGVKETVRYWMFDPPPDWENPFQIMRVEVDPDHETEYLSHTGEEYLLPFEGQGVLYRFYWAEPGSRELPKKKSVNVECGVALRITAEVPHSATGLGSKKTKAWMITRPIQESAPSIYLEPRKRYLKNGPKEETESEKENLDEKSGENEENSVWENPAIYALRAWGISEQIRLQRVKNNLRIKDVADRIPMNVSHYSKIEEASKTANPTLETLKNIARVLDLRLADLITPPTRESWPSDSILFDADPYPSQRQRALFTYESMRKSLIDVAKLPLTSHWNDHFVHLQRWRFAKGEKYDFPEPDDARPVKERANKEWLGDTRWSSTWIVFEGMAKVLIEFNNETFEEAVLSESVLHVRGGGPRLKRFEASENTVVVQVNYSRDPKMCNCREFDDEDHVS